VDESKFFVICHEYGRRFRNKAKRKWLWRICKLPLSFTPNPDEMSYGPYDSEEQAGRAMIEQWHEQERLLDPE
jgi:hypothetical protein